MNIIYLQQNIDCTLHVNVITTHEKKLETKSNYSFMKATLFEIDAYDRVQQLWSHCYL